MRRALIAALGVSSAACSWSRFDEVTESAPVVMLNQPRSMGAGFGLSVLTATRDENTILFVGGAFGQSSAATFNLGFGESPDTDASDVEYCNGAVGQCFLGAPPAVLSHAELDGEEHDFCFPLGLGDTPLQGVGVMTRCADTTVFGYPIPPSFDHDAEFAVQVGQPELLALVADGGEDPWLVAAAPTQPIAWFYRFGSIEPVSLVIPGEPPGSYGTTVGALAKPDGERLLAVGAPEQEGVFLFRADDENVTFLGCLGGTPGFGRAMSSGVVLADDDVPELVISDNRSVFVFDGAVLLDLPQATGNVCTLAALPENGLVSSFGCASQEDITGCNNAQFGVAHGVGDLDGDGDGEIAVGAPGMTTRGMSTAGAVLIWDLEERGDDQLSDVLFMSSAESNDQLGATLALPRIQGRNIVAAGAPGNGKMALFYCSELVPPELRGERCK